MGLWLLLGEYVSVDLEMWLMTVVMLLLLRWRPLLVITPSLGESGKARSGRATCKEAVFYTSGCLVGGVS